MAIVSDEELVARCKKELPANTHSYEILVEMGDYRERLRSTAGTYSVLETGSESGQTATISLPNTFLLQNAVRTLSAPPGSPDQQPQSTGPQEPPEEQ